MTLPSELHIYGQYTQHSEAAIVGNREALLELVTQIQLALANPEKDQDRDFYTGDGEGFTLRVVCAAGGPLDAWARPYVDHDAVDPRRTALSPFWPGDHKPRLVQP